MDARLYPSGRHRMCPLQPADFITSRISDLFLGAPLPNQSTPTHQAEPESDQIKPHFPHFAGMYLTSIISLESGSC